MSMPLTFGDPAATVSKLDKMKTAAVIDGKLIANDIKAVVAGEICKMKKSINKIPGLGVILVGKRKDSSSFVRIKKKACDQVGIASIVAELPEDCTEEEALNVISNFNQQESINGIIVQLPVPRHLDEDKIMNAVSVEKDVDGFHPINMGSLSMSGREPLFIPCAAKGCIEVLIRSGINIIGKKAVVIGRSNIVGLPTFLLLQRHHTMVSMVHAFTKNPEHISLGANIVVSDIGVPNVVRGHWLKEGAVVIDSGRNVVQDSNSLRGYHLAGDVCYEEAIKKASAITPVPGGLGPVTISMLLSNILDSTKCANMII